MLELAVSILVQAAACRHLERCALGHELDDGFDAGEFSCGAYPGEEEAEELLRSIGFYEGLGPDDEGPPTVRT